MDVSRETAALPPTPEAARLIASGTRLASLEEYGELLAGDGVVRGLIGPREVTRLWERHLLNSAALAEMVPAGATVADLGSGAGLPGLVLAIVRPDVRVTLVEPLLRRTTFLEEAVSHLDLRDQVEVVRGRAEALHGERTFDIVTSRAVAALDTLITWSMPLVAPDGAMVALKGSSAAEEIEAAAPLAHELRLAAPELVTVGEALGVPTHVVRVAWADPTAVGWPLARSTRPRRKPGGPRSKNRRRRT